MYLNIFMLRNCYFKFNYKNLFVVKMILFVCYFYLSAEFRLVDRVSYFPLCLILAIFV